MIPTQDHSANELQSDDLWPVYLHLTTIRHVWAGEWNRNVREREEKCAYCSTKKAKVPLSLKKKMPWNAEVWDVSNKMFFPLSSLWIMAEKHLSRNTAEPGTDRSLHARRLISEKFVSASTMNTKRSLAKACSLPCWGQLASLNIRTQLHPGKTLNISLC